MKPKFILFTVLLSGFILISCNKDNPGYTIKDSDYLVFGHYYGLCAGENCIEIFKLYKDSVFEDTLDIYPSSAHPYDGQFVRLSQTDFDSVSYLFNKIPAKLLQESNHVIGMPDYADGGGLYIEVKINGERKYWLIDKMRSNIPDYLVPFVIEAETCIARLQ